MKCNNINCYVENRKLVCETSKSNYNSNFLSINCNYSNENKSISLSADKPLYVESISNEVFVKILSEVKQIKEIKIPNIKVYNFSYSTFKNLENLTSLTIMNPKNIEENSFRNIRANNQFRLFIICPHNETENLGLSTLLLQSNNWEISVFHCHGIYKCQFDNCNNINNITLKPDHIQWNNTKLLQTFSNYNCGGFPCHSISQISTENTIKSKLPSSTENTIKSKLPSSTENAIKSTEKISKYNLVKKIIIILVICVSVVGLFLLIFHVILKKIKQRRIQKYFDSTPRLFINYED